ncbi:PriCT-2 domain-containing protein [Pontibacter sp. E15-1]|uniref:PriCT-2 domain-containing protein n=1 Tax=Pontibacter sp. E15-1 TaxID=2919918 RepID=UPI001F4F5F95|nr:PriCT-2 domain-containing protein [Pontibacter sp. E15-1]MCJ8165459.1 PriCT-2 domain-containing protein [Pontibacter sp. E15-1]
MAAFRSNSTPTPAEKPVKKAAPVNQEEADLEHVVSQLESRRIDLTTDYGDWVKMGFAFASLGDTGRKYFHRVSSIYTGYDYQECDKQFDISYRNHDGRTNIASFFQYCKDGGLDISASAQNRIDNQPRLPKTPALQATATSELTMEERYEALQKFRFSADKPIPKPEPGISIDGNVIATPGNLITFVGQAKSGKSGIVAGITAGALALPGDIIDTLGFTVQRNVDEKAFIHIDSEQSYYNHYAGMMKVLKRAGRPREPDWLHSYNFKSIDIAARTEDLSMLFQVLSERHGGIHMAVIDGGADLVFDPNDQKESNTSIAFLEALANQHNCVIIVVVHFNPGSDGKVRGHYGSQLERKCESVVAVSKDEDSEISTIKGKYLRNSGLIPNLQFRYDVEKGYHIYCGTLTKVSRADKKQSELQLLAKSVFEAGLKQYTYTKLYETIMKLEDVKDRTAKSRIKDMLEANLIMKTGDEEPVYSLITPPENTSD